MLNVGMVGVGCISGIYLKNFQEVFRDVRLVAVCDLIRERAAKAQRDYGVPKLYDTMEELRCSIREILDTLKAEDAAGSNLVYPLFHVESL